MKTEGRLMREVGMGAARRGLVRAWALVVAVGVGLRHDAIQVDLARSGGAANHAPGTEGRGVHAVAEREHAAIGEDILARELTARGVQGIAGYQLTGGQPIQDSEVLRRKLAEAGLDGAVIIRVVDRRQEVNYVPGGPYYGTMYGYWDYGWAMAARPGYSRRTPSSP